MIHITDEDLSAKFFGVASEMVDIFQNKIYLSSSYSENQIKEMRNARVKQIQHLNKVRQNYIDFIVGEDPEYPKEYLKISDQGDYSRDIDLPVKNSYHLSNIKNPCREIYEEAIPGKDMKEYGMPAEHKLRTIWCGDDGIIRKRFYDNGCDGRILIIAPTIQGNSSSISKVPLTAIVFLINDDFGIFTHIWECRICIPYNEWDGTGEANTRRTGFQLTQEHFLNKEKYNFQCIIGDIKPYVLTRRCNAYMTNPGLILMPIPSIKN